MYDNLDDLRCIGFANVSWAGDDDYMCITRDNSIIMIYIINSNIILKCKNAYAVYSIMDTTLQRAVLNFMNDNNIK